MVLFAWMPQLGLCHNRLKWVVSPVFLVVASFQRATHVDGVCARHPVFQFGRHENHFENQCDDRVCNCCQMTVNVPRNGCSWHLLFCLPVACGNLTLPLDLSVFASRWA
jgi:hypothetical protein